MAYEKTIAGITIGIKNIKHSEFASQETNCFSATVFINGKRSFTASNDGHGGCDNHHSLTGLAPNAVWDVVKTINTQLKTVKIEGWDLNYDLDVVIGELLDNWLIDKHIKKVLKKITYVENPLNPNGKFRVYSVPHKPLPAIIEAYKKSSAFKPPYLVLNELPIEQVRKYFK